MEWLSRITDLAKVPTRFFAVLAIASGLLIFLPLSWLSQMSITQIREGYAPYIGAAFVLSISLLVVELGIWFYGRNQRERQKKTAESAVQNSMLELDGAEKTVLREFFIKSTKSLRLPIDQPAVASLLNTGVLVHATSSGVRTTVGSVFSLSLSKPAQALLSPTLLDLGPFIIHTDDGKWGLTEEGENWLMANRPRFILELERHFSRLEERSW